MFGRTSSVCSLTALLALAFQACSVDDRTLSPACEDGSSAQGGGCAQGGATARAGATASGARTASGGKSGNPDGGAGGDGGLSNAGQASVGGNTTCPDLDQNTVPDCSETLLENPTFDRNANGWHALANTAVSWDSYDAQANQSSGSLLIENRAATSSAGNGFVLGGATQCVPITPDGAYVIFAQMYSGSSTVSGYGSVVGRVFESEDCSGTPISVTPSANSGTVNLWITLQTTIAAPVGAQSLLIELSVGKLADNAERVNLRFDNVLVR